jgi:hypothetical protein
MALITFEKQEPSVLLPQGHVCAVRVDSVEDCVSQSGNEMLKLKVKALDDKGEVVRSLNEYLVFTPKAQWKISQFLESVGMASETGQQVEVSAETLTNAEGRVRIAQETYNDQDGKEQVTNRIGTWLSPNADAD